MKFPSYCGCWLPMSRLWCAVLRAACRALRALKEYDYLRDALVRLPESGGTSSASGLDKGEWIEFLACVGDITSMNRLVA